MRWNVTTDHAWIVFNPFALIWKQVRFYKVGIGEAGFRFVEKKRVDGPRKKDSLAASFYPAVAFPKAVKPKKKDEKPGGSKWGIQMAGVSIGRLYEAWVDEYRYVGGIGITGGFRIVPDKEVEVGPATVVFSPGEFYLGPNKIAERMEGKIEYKMEAFDPDADDSIIFKSVQMHAEISAKPDTLDPLNVYFSSIPWFRLGDGAGTLSLDVRVMDGRVVPPGKIGFDTDALHLRLGKFLATGAAHLHWEMLEGKAAGKARSTFNGDLRDVGIAYRKEKDFLTGADLSVAGSTEDLDFDKLFQKLDMTVSLKHARTSNLKSINQLLPPQSPVRFESGSAEVEMFLETHSGSKQLDRGRFELKGRQAGIHLKPQSLVGNLEVSLPFERSRLAKGEIHFVDPKVSYLDATVSSAKSPTTWWAQVKMPTADFVAEPTSIRADFDVLMKNSLPLVPLITGAGMLSNILTVENVNCKGQFAVGPDGFDLTGLNFDSSSLKVQGFYTEKEGQAFARMLVVLNPFAVGILVAQSQTRLILNDAFKWFKTSPQTAAEIQAEPVTK